MSERATELGPTGSIMPGRSIATMLELVSSPSEIGMNDQVRDAWQAVTTLYTHIDNRCDLDHPNSKPDNAEDQVEWSPWLDYLQADPREAKPLPDNGELTGIQCSAFVDMHAQFERLGLGLDRRWEFVTALKQFMYSSERAKQATTIGDRNFLTPWRQRNGLAYWRQREGLAIAHMFAAVVPDNSGAEAGRGPKFRNFIRTAEALGRVAKLRDSMNDMDRDMDHGNVNIEPSPLRHASLLGRAAWRGMSVLKTHHRPSEVKAFWDKARAWKKNRHGDLNANRIHA